MIQKAQIPCGPTVSEPVNGPLETTEGKAKMATEETLDPRDWEEFRGLAHTAIDRMIDFQRDIRDQPAWRPLPRELDGRFSEGPPLQGIGTEGALRDFRTLVEPYPTGNIHPRFWGWAAGTGSPMGMLAEFLSAGLNPIAGLFNDSASRVEGQLINWMKVVFRFPSDADGILTSGGSVANLVGLTAARDTKARSGGLAGAPPLTLYASKEVHSSVVKAARILGLGAEAVRLISVDQEYRIRCPELLAAIEEDRGSGKTPFALVGSAGTINTGAVDDLNALARIARKEELWFHVDGAFGAIAALSPATRSLVAGMNLADSLGFDFHKWMHAPYEAGCVLVREAKALRRSFSVGADYTRPLERGLAQQADSAGLRGLQLSRGFKALKVWLTLKEQGVEKLGRLVAQNVRQAKYLGTLVDESPLFDRVAPVSLNIVAFRHQPPGMPVRVVDKVNREVLMRIQEQGLAVPSATVLDGRFTIRVCICNHRTRADDLEAFLQDAERILEEVKTDMGL